MAMSVTGPESMCDHFDIIRTDDVEGQPSRSDASEAGCGHGNRRAPPKRNRDPEPR
jgi:hypothetical protein